MSRQKIKKNILIIGGGIHGITIALELAKKYNITIVDSTREILSGTSKNNHNRIHLGYHYPRSKETIQECKLGYKFFIEKYKNCLVFPDFYYVISKKSRINSKDYKNIMQEHDLDCFSSWPEPKFLDKKNIEDSFKVNEACINIAKFRKKIKKKLQKLKVQTYLNFKINKVKRNNKNNFTLHSSNKSITLKTDIIVNCAYTNSNNILKIFGIKDNITKYIFEEAEVAVVESKLKIPALTVMDGPYISILPFAGKKNQYLVYDVTNSVIHKNIGYFYQQKKHTRSNWNKMLKQGLKYYPFFNELKYKYSLYANRPIPVNIKGDSRATRIIKQKYDIDFYSIKEGKLISAPYIAQQFKNILQNE